MDRKFRALQRIISQRTHLIKTLRPGWSPRTRYSPPRRHARHSLLVSAVRNFAPFRRRSVQQQKLFQMPSIGQIGPATLVLFLSLWTNLTSGGSVRNYLERPSQTAFDGRDDGCDCESRPPRNIGCCGLQMGRGFSAFLLVKQW